MRGDGMSGRGDRQVKIWATLAIVAGIALLLGVKLTEEPDASARDLLFELIENLPAVLTSVGLAMLFQITRRQHEDQMTLIRDLEAARVHGQRWRSEARTFINGLGVAMDAQFARWALTKAEREVALLLLKGLSLKEISVVRATNERTVRSQSRTLYSKAGLSGRAALSAFFLEDLLAPASGADSPVLMDDGSEERADKRSLQ
jgi:DNA-binding CsgD family transcriptional regulator